MRWIVGRTARRLTPLIRSMQERREMAYHSIAGITREDGDDRIATWQGRVSRIGSWRIPTDIEGELLLHFSWDRDVTKVRLHCDGMILRKANRVNRGEIFLATGDPTCGLYLPHVSNSKFSITWKCRGLRSATVTRTSYLNPRLPNSKLTWIYQLSGKTYHATDWKNLSDRHNFTFNPPRPCSYGSAGLVYSS